MRSADVRAESCDFVVVGAGSAGCVVANRLSADPTNRVVLLEAGPRDASPWLHIPIGYYKTMVHPKFGWGYETDPVPGCNDRRIVWPRGKVLGGSSTINGLVYVRGQAQDFDHWRQLGNTGWGWDDVLPYFIKSERQQRGASAHHGGDGELGVSDAHRDELCDSYIEAAQQTGLPLNDDFNGAHQEGVGYFQLTAWRGLRSSSSSAFLRPARSRSNLRTVTDALVERVLFDGKQAVGVVYRRAQAAYELRANREIILCGGAVNSPQLLQLSGIGPGETLRAHGVPPIVDKPGVGANLQDHYQARNVYECTRALTVNDEVRNPARKLWAGLRWLISRTGPLTIGAGHVGIFARTRPELVTPDIQFHFIRFSADRPGGKLHDFSGFTACVCQLRPESRGTICIRSPDPKSAPSIQPNYLESRLDRETMLAGMRLARSIIEKPAVKGYVRREVLPGPEVHTDEHLMDYIRDTGTTIFHPTSTCKMGRDEMAVVDEQLRVHGVDRLRVADASIMPSVVSGNTNAACIMIGEKAADMILAAAR